MASEEEFLEFASQSTCSEPGGRDSRSQWVAQEKVMSAAPEEKDTESLSGDAGDKLCLPFLALTLSLLSNKPREGSQPRGGSSAM